MDNVDIQLLSALEADGRRSFLIVAQNSGLTKTTCRSRVQNLEKSGSSRGDRTVVDPVALGFKVTAYVQVEISEGTRNASERAVMLNHPIVECTTKAGHAEVARKKLPSTSICWDRTNA